MNDLLQWSRALSGWSSMNSLDIAKNQPLTINHKKKKSLSAATQQNNKKNVQKQYQKTPFNRTSNFKDKYENSVDEVYNFKQREQKRIGNPISNLLTTDREQNFKNKRMQSNRFVQNTINEHCCQKNSVKELKKLMEFLQSDNKMKYECHKNYHKRISDKCFFKNQDNQIQEIQIKPLQDISNVNTTYNGQNNVSKQNKTENNQYKSLTMAILNLGQKKEQKQSQKFEKTEIIYPKFIIRNKENHRQSSLGNGSRTFFTKVYKDLKKNGILNWKDKSSDNQNEQYAENEMNYLINIKKKKKSLNEVERNLKRKLIISDQ